MQRLQISGCFLVDSLMPLAQCQNLSHLDVSGCFKLEDLSPLACCSGLQYLDLWHCFKVREKITKKGRRKQERKDVLFTPPTPTPTPTPTTPTLYQNFQIRNLTPLSKGFQALRSFRLSHCIHKLDLSALSCCPELSHLCLVCCSQLEDITQLAVCTK
jgi:hypothetical protein